MLARLASKDISTQSARLGARRLAIGRMLAQAETAVLAWIRPGSWASTSTTVAVAVAAWGGFASTPRLT